MGIALLLIRLHCTAMHARTHTHTELHGYCTAAHLWQRQLALPLHIGIPEGLLQQLPQLLRIQSLQVLHAPRT
jgi:hypothetical protein